MTKAQEEQNEDREARERIGPLYSHKVYADDTGQHIFTVSAALDNEENRESTEAAVRQEAKRRVQDGDWLQDEHYILAV